MKLKNILNQPYPPVEHTWTVIIAISCFISLFLLIFQPFELSKVEGYYRYLIYIGYGGVTFLALLFNMLLLPALFKDYFSEKNWTVKKQILFFAWILFTIGIGNFIYTVFTTPFYNLDLYGFINFQFFTLIVGIFPIAFLVLIQQNYLYRRHLKSVAELNNIIPQLRAGSRTNNDTLVIPAENEKDSFKLHPEQLLFIESMGNYLKIYYHNQGKINQEILRNSLKNAESAIEKFPEIIRCHRAYVVNLLSIEDAVGNSQGYRLKLKGVDHEVPVSRSYIPALKHHLQHLQKVN